MLLLRIPTRRPRRADAPYQTASVRLDGADPVMAWVPSASTACRACRT